MVAKTLWLAHEDRPKPPTTTAGVDGAELLEEPPPTLHLTATVTGSSSVGGAGVAIAREEIGDLPMSVGATSQSKVTLRTLDEDARKKV